MKDNKKTIIGILGVLLGLFLVKQLFSFSNVNRLDSRDLESNIFQEIQILKVQNEDLTVELNELESNFDQLTDTNSIIEAIESEIKKYQKLSGDYPIYGPGIEIIINEELSTTWVIDLINEIFNSGAEAVAINGIRITNKVYGIDSLPKGQILINEAVINSPITFEAIGEPTLIQEVLESPGGIVDRIEKFFSKDVVSISTKEMIQMN